MNEPADFLPLLREIRAEVTTRHHEVLAWFDAIDKRIDGIEHAQTLLLAQIAQLHDADATRAILRKLAHVTPAQD